MSPSGMDIQSFPSLSFSQISCNKCSNANTVIGLCGQCGHSFPLCIKHTPLLEERNQPIESSSEQAVLRDQFLHLEQQILAIQNVIESLSNSRDALESWVVWHRHRQAPIHKIPAEILLLVMEFAVEENDVTGRMDALVISQVSHRWRELARSTSLLWSRIRVYEFPPTKTNYRTAITSYKERLELCLMLARDKLLDIEILDLGSSAYAPTSSTMAQLSVSIAGCCQKWKSLTVSLETLDLFIPADIQADRLMYLCLTDGIGLTRIPNLVNSAPTLRCLDMTNIVSRASKYGINDEVSLDQLREFHGRIHWNDWDGISLPTMDTLDLHIDPEDLLDYTDSILYLPHLQCLSLAFDPSTNWTTASEAFDTNSIFTRFSCPELLFLTLKSAPIACNTAAIMCTMLVDPKSKNASQILLILHLHDCKITSSSLQSLLALLPNLRQFTFVDRDVNGVSSPLDQALYAWLSKGALLPRLTDLCIGERCSRWRTNGLFFFLRFRVLFLKKVTLYASVNEGVIMDDHIRFIMTEVEAFQKRGFDITFWFLEGIDWESPNQRRPGFEGVGF
ncbi:hypothetical protein DL96DRAFT_1560303 [Flagelloscypha sp. PMI_526]|nr:hypothetical protein DL96DRAFT_1560303 [Flagelloscypha sp. PMI_526]